MVKTLTRKKKLTLRPRSGQAAKKPVMKKGKAKVMKMKSKSKVKSKAKKAMVKKVAKKVTKKLMKKTVARKAAMAGTLGKVVHYYDKIGVAIVKLTGTITVGELLTFRRGEREFTQPVSSIQIDHKPVNKAGKGKVVGIKVVQVADPGTLVFNG